MHWLEPGGADFVLDPVAEVAVDRRPCCRVVLEGQGNAADGGVLRDDRDNGRGEEVALDGARANRRDHVRAGAESAEGEHAELDGAVGAGLDFFAGGVAFDHCRLGRGGVDAHADGDLRRTGGAPAQDGWRCQQSGGSGPDQFPSCDFHCVWFLPMGGAGGLFWTGLGPASIRWIRCGDG